MCSACLSSPPPSFFPCSVAKSALLLRIRRLHEGKRHQRPSDSAVLGCTGQRPLPPSLSSAFAHDPFPTFAVLDVRALQRHSHLCRRLDRHSTATDLGFDSGNRERCVDLPYVFLLSSSPFSPVAILPTCTLHSSRPRTITAECGERKLGNEGRKDGREEHGNRADDAQGDEGGGRRQSSLPRSSSYCRRSSTLYVSRSSSPFTETMTDAFLPFSDVAFNFAAYELLKLQISGGSTQAVDQPGTFSKLACGAIAGGISQTITFPADLLRRRMQMVGLKDSSLGYHYTGAWDGAFIPLSVSLRRKTDVFSLSCLFSAPFSTPFPPFPPLPLLPPTQPSSPSSEPKEFAVFTRGFGQIS